MTLNLTTIRSGEPLRSQLILNANRRICLTYGPFDFFTSMTKKNQPALTLFLPEVISRNPRSKLVKAVLSWSVYERTSSNNVLKAHIHNITGCVATSYMAAYQASTSKIYGLQSYVFDWIRTGMSVRLKGSVLSSGIYEIVDINSNSREFTISPSAGSEDDPYVYMFVTTDVTRRVSIPGYVGAVDLGLSSYYSGESMVNGQDATLWQLQFDSVVEDDGNDSIFLGGVSLDLELEPVMVAGSTDSMTYI